MNSKIAVTPDSRASLDFTTVQRPYSAHAGLVMIGVAVCTIVTFATYAIDLIGIGGVAPCLFIVGAGWIGTRERPFQMNMRGEDLNVSGFAGKWFPKHVSVSVKVVGAASASAEPRRVMAWFGWLDGTSLVIQTDESNLIFPSIVDPEGTTSSLVKRIGGSRASVGL